MTDKSSTESRPAEQKRGDAGFQGGRGLPYGRKRDEISQTKKCTDEKPVKKILKKRISDYREEAFFRYVFTGRLSDD